MFGLKVLDGGGAPVLDISDRLTRVIGTFSIPGGKKFYEGSINNPVIQTGAFWYALINNQIDVKTDMPYAFPTISVSGSVINWHTPKYTSRSGQKVNFDKSLVASCLVIYGVY